LTFADAFAASAVAKKVNKVVLPLEIELAYLPGSSVQP
jgi:hypothetical protein